MSDKQPLIGGPSAPPPPYNPPHAPPYPTGAAGGGAAYPQPPAYPSGPPPPQTGTYGTTQTNTNVTVVQAQPVAPRVVIEPKPPNYIVLSVVVLFAFCWIFGLIALLSAMQVDSAWESGDRAGARRLSATARGWSFAGMIVGAVVYVLVVVSIIASAAIGG